MWRGAWLVASLLVFLCAADHNKKADTFWISSRYGRSLNAHTDLSTRNRFFLTNRYGKRTGDSTTEQLIDRSASRWKKQFMCDCVPTRLDKRRICRGLDF